jgi:hypothetical protein
MAYRTPEPRPPEPAVPFDWTRVTGPLRKVLMPFLRIFKILTFPLFFICYHASHGIWYPLNFAVGYVFFGNSCHFLRRSGRSHRQGYGGSEYTWYETVDVKTQYGGSETMIYELTPVFPKINWWDLGEPKKEEKE